MKKLSFKMSGLILVVLLLCACSGIYQAYSRLNLLSDQEEVRLGEQVKKEIESTEKVLEDPEITSYVNNIGQKVAPYLQPRSFGYEFKVLESEAINAFATPGGHCYVYTGLIKYADDESELAAVIAHECSHVVAEHIGRQLTNDAGYAGYLERMKRDVAAFRKDEALALPDDIDYLAIPGLSREISQRLAAARPATLGSAARISGITPAAITLLLRYVRKRPADMPDQAELSA